MTIFKFGQILLVRFPFSDQRGSKQRPAVVISNAQYNKARPDIILMAVTSQLKPRIAFGDAVIQDWKGAGLIKPSAIKPIVFTAERSIIRKSLGKLSVEDQANLKGVINTIIDR